MVAAQGEDGPGGSRTAQRGQRDSSEDGGVGRGLSPPLHLHPFITLFLYPSAHYPSAAYVALHAAALSCVVGPCGIILMLSGAEACTQVSRPGKLGCRAHARLQGARSMARDQLTRDGGRPLLQAILTLLE
jgi:hypothetical protein